MGSAHNILRSTAAKVQYIRVLLTHSIPVRVDAMLYMCQQSWYVLLKLKVQSESVIYQSLSILASSVC